MYMYISLLILTIGDKTYLVEVWNEHGRSIHVCVHLTIKIAKLQLW